MHSVCFFYKRSDVYLLDSRGELAYGLGYNDSRHRILTENQFRNLLVTNAENKKIVFITEQSMLEDYECLPKPVSEHTDDYLLFYEY